MQRLSCPLVGPPYSFAPDRLRAWWALGAISSRAPLELVAKLSLIAVSVASASDGRWCFDGQHFRGEAPLTFIYQPSIRIANLTRVHPLHIG